MEGRWRGGGRDLGLLSSRLARPAITQISSTLTLTLTLTLALTLALALALTLTCDHEDVLARDDAVPADVEQREDTLEVLQLNVQVLHGVLPASYRPRLGARGRGRTYRGGWQAALPHAGGLTQPGHTANPEQS